MVTYQRHTEKYIFICFQIEWNMIVVTVFFFDFEPNEISFDLMMTV